MAITPKTSGKPDAPNSLGNQAEGAVGNPNSPSSSTEGSLGNPNPVLPDLVARAGNPNTPSSSSEGQVVAPNALTSQAEGGIGNPTTPSASTIGSLTNPNSPAPSAEGTVTVPNTLTSKSSPFPRTLQPLVSMNFADQLYQQVGNEVAFDNLFTYSRSSSASFINRREVNNRYEYFLDTDYVGDVTNLITFSEQFDNADWSKVNSSILPNSSISPDNTMTADKFTDDQSDGIHTVDSTSINITSGTAYTGSFYVKNIDINVVRVDFSGFANWVGSPFAAFDIKTGALLQTGSDEVSGSIIPVGQGWYRISMTATASASTTSNLKVVLTDGTASGASYIGALESCYIWGAQLTESAKPLPYVKTISTSVTQTFTETLRIEYDPVNGESLGALIEGASTNLVLRSEEFGDAVWSKTRASVTENQQDSPDGTLSADKFIEDSTSNTHFLNFSYTVSDNDTWTLSLYMRASERRFGTIRLRTRAGVNIGASFDLSLGVLGIVEAGAVATIKDASNGWHRCSVTIDVGSGVGVGNAFIYTGETSAVGESYQGDGSSGIYIWGAQLEQQPFSTSYIRTEASSVTRAADDLSLPSAGNVVDGDGEYSINTNINLIFVNAAGAGTNQHIIDVDGENQKLIRAMDNQDGRVLYTHGVTQIDSLSPLIKNTNYKISTTINSSELSLYLDGVEVGNGAITSVTGTAVSIKIGSAGDGGGAQYLQGHIKDLSIYDVALTAQEVSLL